MGAGAGAHLPIPSHYPYFPQRPTAGVDTPANADADANHVLRAVNVECSGSTVSIHAASTSTKLECKTVGSISAHTATAERARPRPPPHLLLSNSTALVLATTPGHLAARSVDAGSISDSAAVNATTTVDVIATTDTDTDVADAATATSATATAATTAIDTAAAAAMPAATTAPAAMATRAEATGGPTPQGEATPHHAHTHAATTVAPTPQHAHTHAATALAPDTVKVKVKVKTEPRTDEPCILPAAYQVLGPAGPVPEMHASLSRKYKPKPSRGMDGDYWDIEAIGARGDRAKVGPGSASHPCANPPVGVLHDNVSNSGSQLTFAGRAACAALVVSAAGSRRCSGSGKSTRASTLGGTATASKTAAK